MYFECQEKNVNYGVICTLVLKINVGHNAFSFRITSTWESLGKLRGTFKGKKGGLKLENKLVKSLY